MSKQSDRTREGAQLMTSIGRMRRATRRMSGTDYLAAAQLEMLSILARRESKGQTPVYVGELSEGTGASLSTVSRAITQMEERGYIRREPGSDRRRVCVSLTKAGYALLNATENNALRVAQELRGSMGSARYEQLLALMTEAADRLLALTGE